MDRIKKFLARYVKSNSANAHRHYESSKSRKARPSDSIPSSGSRSLGRHSGYETQFFGCNDALRRRQIVIGLDFGTAFTKVVVGETTKAYPVPLAPDKHGINRFLIPCELSEMLDGELKLGSCVGAIHHRNLKMPILEGDHSLRVCSTIIGFMALVLRDTRTWFLNEYRHTYGDVRIDWCLNTGLPTGQYHDENLKELYEKIIDTAWHVSLDPSRLNLKFISRCLDSTSPMANDLEIGLFPEFVAQINSYIKSPLRQGDLHLLVDVGAGTLDIAVFIAHENEQGDMFPICAKSVTRHGVDYLPSEASDKQKFYFEVKALIRTTVESVRDGKYPQFFRTDFEKVLPFFLCGGGSQLSFYKSMSSEIVDDGRPCKYRAMTLPTPTRLDSIGIQSTDYHRLSVAYGLSFDKYDIGKIVPESEVPELNRKAQNQSQDFQTCPSCNGSGGAHGSGCPKCDGNGWIN